MNNITRILIVEDLLTDYELAQREIRRAVETCKFERVEKPEEFLKALEEFQPDLILSDYVLPGFDGRKVLKLVQEYSPSVPVIIWTGVMGESVAVDCLKMGASNYVLKNDIKHLRPAILRALEERNLQLENKRVEEKYRTIFENAMEGIFQSTLDGRFLSVNPAMARIYGYSSPEEMVESVTDISSQIYADPSTRSHFTEILLSNGSIANFEMKNLRKDGSIIWTSTSGRAVRGEAGNFLYFEGFLQDITERKQAEEALKDNEERFRMIYQNAEDMIWTMNMDFRLTFVSPAVERALGYSAQEILDSNPEKFLTPASYEQGLKTFWEEVEKVRLQPDPNYARLLEMECRRKDGSTFWVETKFSFFRDVNGYPTAVLGMGRDITQRKQVEAHVKDLLEFNEKILNHSPLGILTYKGTGECVFANQNAASILGAEVEVLLTQNFHAIPSWKESGLYDLANQAISTDSPVTADIHVRSTFGKDLWLQAHFVPFKSKEEIHVLLCITDITEPKLADEELRKSENRLILALSAAQMSVWEWDLETNHILWSPQFYSIAGITEAAFDGTFEGYANLIHPQDTERVLQAAKYAVASNTIFAEEFRVIRPDGEIRWLANLGHAEYRQSDSSLRMIGTVQDITRRKQVEIERQALLEIMQGLAKTEDLHEFLALIHRSIGNVIYAENFFVIFHNRDTGLFEEIYSVDQFDPPAPPSTLEKSITSYVFRTGEPLLLGHKQFDELAARGEVELIGTNSASWLGAPIKTLNETIGVIAVQDYENPNRYQDHDKNFLASIAMQVAFAIERKQAEEKVRKSEARYRALFEASPISIWEEDFSQVKKYLEVLKQEGVTDFRSYFASHPEIVTKCNRMIDVLDVNHAGLQMYQAESKRQLIESTLQAPSRGEEEHNHEDFIAIAEGRTSNSWEGGDETLTGEPLEIYLRWSVAPGYEHDFSRIIVTVINITERKQMERALAEERNQLARRVEERTADLSRANSSLARALRVKDEFLANMSHELRTPLNAILGLSESLAEQVAGPLNEKQQKYLSTINESGHHLLSLINDILDLAKIEAGQITLDINRVDVNSVCQASLRMVKQMAQKKNQEVVFEIDSDLGLMWADERRLKQMIVNLLSNAVKFSPEFSRIGLEVRGVRAANKVIISVWDTGVGIQEQDLERLFKPFVQLDTGLAREAQGTGLGLALVAQMARMHGGSVHALSTAGQGSRFIIQLPWEPAMASDMTARLRNTGKFPAIDPNADRPTILLIEDTREVVMMLVDYLEMAGYKMVTAQDGIDGLEQAKIHRPDLILMDIQMPRMNGFETTQKLKSDLEFRNVPIIALTALAMPNDRQRCLEAGMDEYISKPVNLKELTKTIKRLLSRETARL